MNAPKLISVFIGALIVGGLALLGWQRHTALELRGEISRQRAHAGERARLSSENQRLAAALVSAEELEKLRAERAAVEGLRAEISTMKRRAEATTRTVMSARPVATKAVAPVPSMKESAVPAMLWKNAGQASPAAAFETALWSAAGGEVESLAALLVFDAESRAGAEALFANLPAGMRQELVSSDRLIALLAAKDVPLGSARILSDTGEGSNALLVAQLLDPEGKSKRVRLAMREEEGRWRFVVPASAMERYATQLQTPVAAR